MDSQYLSVIKSCLNGDGLVTFLPAKRKKKLLVLCYLAEQIPDNTCCSERDFNALISRMHTFGDPATLRRELYDFGLIDRDPDGSRYRLPSERPTPETLLSRFFDGH